MVILLLSSTFCLILSIIMWIYLIFRLNEKTQFYHPLNEIFSWGSMILFIIFCILNGYIISLL
jgi:hypothetical protein